MVCLQVFDEGEHTPRVLSCGHSVCQSCVADLRSHWGAGSKGSSKVGGLVLCPECKQHTKVPLGGFLELPKNIELMRLIQSVPKTPIASKAGEGNAEEAKKTLAKKEQSRRKEDEDSTLAFPLSEVVYGEPVIWVLPQAAVTRRKDMVHGVCVGDMDTKLQSKVQEVSLQFLSTIDPNEGKKLKYKERIRLAWEALNPKIRAKLVRLLALGCHYNYFPELAGLWMSGEGILYLVSKVYVDGIKQARSLFSPTNSDHGTEGSSCESLKEDNIALRTLIRLGVELCEILMEIHAAGLSVGILRADSFSLDAYCHLRLHVGKCIFWTRSVGESSECFSPEVLKNIKKSEDTDISEYGSGDEADVWSLGCLLLQLLSGSSLLGGLTHSEFHDVVRGKRAQPEVLEQSVRFQEQLLSCMAAVPSNRPRVVDVWRELKELLDDQALETPSHFVEDSSEDKLDMETCESGNITPADNSWIEPEARVNAVRDPQTPPIEATMDAPSLSKALIDAIHCDAEVRTLQGHLDTVSCLSVCGTANSDL